MDCGMYWIDFHSGNNVEARLLKTQRQAPSTGKKINTYWSHKNASH